MIWLKKNFLYFLIGSLTLGLLPYNDPHLFGKIKWIMGGGAIVGDQTMALIDWFDLLMHGSPWLLLFLSLIAFLISWLKKAKN